jgi:hypothetical protein
MVPLRTPKLPASKHEARAKARYLWGSAAPTAKETQRRASARIEPAAVTKMSFRIFIGSDINRRLVVGLRPAPPPPQEDGGEDKEQAKDGGDQEFAVGFHWVGWLESAVLVIGPGLGWVWPAK